MELFSRSSNRYKCNFGLCCKSSPTIDQAIFHSKRHNNQGTHCCDMCFYTTNRLRLLKEHKLQHNDDLPFACTQCTYKTTRRSRLNRHIESHLRVKSNLVRRGNPINSTLLCQYDNCEYRAMNKLDLLDHVKSHINPSTTRNISGSKHPNMLQILIAVAMEEDDLSNISGTDIMTAEIVESDTAEHENVDVEHFDLIDSAELIQPLLAEIVDDDSEDVDNISAEDPHYVD